MAKDLKLTPISEWRQTDELVQLPSGRVVKLRRLNVLGMIRGNENVPNFLRSRVSEQLVGGTKKSKTDDFNLNDAVESLYFMAMQVFVFPKLVDGDPQHDDEVNIEAVSEEDLSFAVGYGTGDRAVINAVNQFRHQQNGNVEPIPAGADVAGETE